MKKLKTLINVLILVTLFTINSYSQTKKEKKMKTTDLTTGMYGSSESKEAKEYFEKGTEFTNKEDFKTAIKWYKKAIEADSKFVEAYDNLGVAYRKLGDLKNATKYYKQSIELYPQGNMAHQNLAIVYLIEKKYEEAIEQYGIMQKNDSTDPEGYYGTIRIYITLKDYKSAIKNATKTLEIYEATNSPYLTEAQYLLGLSYYYDGDTKNAKTYIEQAKNTGTSVPETLIKELGIK